MQAFESVSTWRQPAPAPASAVRTNLLAEVRPQSLADLVIDNRDFANPRILSRRGA